MGLWYGYGYGDEQTAQSLTATTDAAELTMQQANRLRYQLWRDATVASIRSQAGFQLGPNNTATARGAGVGQILFADGSNRNCLGFLTTRAGGTKVYVPVFGAQ